MKSPNRIFDGSAAITRNVAAWVADLRYEDLPETTRRAVRAATLDTLGAGLYGLRTPWTKMTCEWVRRGVHPGGEKALASVWGDPSPSLRAVDAALANGVAAHAFELDDFHAVKLHPGAVVLPTALALAEARHSSGQALLTAIAAGYELMIRTSAALGPAAAKTRGWHLTGVCGSIGAAAAGAVLLGLDAERTTWAIGLGGTQSAGLFAFNSDGAMSKRLHAGCAARNGVFAAELAELGFTGPTQLYEAADGGFLRAFSDAARNGPLTEELGKTYGLEATMFKPYSSCGSLHSYIDAALELCSRTGGPPNASQRIRAGMSDVVNVQCGFDYEPGTELNAQMSARYCLATAFLEGAVLPAQFTPEKIRDPAIVDLARRIELVHDPELDEIYPQHFVGWVELEKPDGDDFERVYVLDPSGSVANPNREAALVNKFRALMEKDMDPETISHLEAAVFGLGEDSSTARDMTSLLARLSRPMR
jgi:2-methylcitrate dehydratase PrpD